MSTSSARSGVPGAVIRVGQLVVRLAERIGADQALQDVWVEGEVVQAQVSPAGHVYFTLRDNAGSLPCVLFATQAQALPLLPRDGMKVIAHGRVEVYVARGRCQLRVDDVLPAGAGEKALRLEALRRRLEAEGLFRAERKRSLPTRPRRVGVVTSASGAAWHDIRTVVARRDPRIELVFAPAVVQGPLAAESLIAALDGLARVRALDAVIVARGGGASEDLSAFNDEALVRAVARCRVPVCSGVGHESDTTLVDHVADVRAPTPSVAAELVVPDAAGEAAIAGRHRDRITARIRQAVARRRSRLDVARRLVDRRAPQARVGSWRQRLDEGRREIDRAAARLLPARRRRLDDMRRGIDRAMARVLPARRLRTTAARRRLEGLSPLAVLGRGYAIVEGADGRARTDATSLRAGDDVTLRLRDGRVGARIREGRP